MRFEDLRSMAKHFEMTINKLMWYQRENHLKIPPKIDKQYYEITDEWIKELQRLNKITTAEWNELTTLKHYGTRKRGSYNQKPISQIKLDKEHGNNYVRELERLQAESEREYESRYQSQKRFSPAYMQKVRDDLEKRKRLKLKIESTKKYVCDLTKESL
jgi:hypothetical protein